MRQSNIQSCSGLDSTGIEAILMSKNVIDITVNLTKKWKEKRNQELSIGPQCHAHCCNEYRYMWAIWARHYHIIQTKDGIDIKRMPPQILSKRYSSLQYILASAAILVNILYLSTMEN